MIENNNHISADDNVQDLIDLMKTSPENYKHLQIFLSRDGMPHRFHDDEYLMISKDVFGKIRLLDIRVDGDYIFIEFLDIEMQEVGNLQVDINDKNQKVLFVNWNDVRNMVMAENKPMLNDNELLELEY